jgi:hypothetical protein
LMVQRQRNHILIDLSSPIFFGHLYLLSFTLSSAAFSNLLVTSTLAKFTTTSSGIHGGNIGNRIKRIFRRVIHS